MTHLNLPRRLFPFAAAFLFLFSVILTLSPAVRERAWSADLRWGHWIGFAVWLALYLLASRVTARRLPDLDPFILPSAFLLCGWGLLAIWRLDPYFGARQTVWLVVSAVAFLLALHLPADLTRLRRYKYLTLLGGILLTALTLAFGSNPSGAGPRLWIGGADVYLQPSEPLKLLLVIYLAAYLADRLPVETLQSGPAPRSLRRALSIPLLVPTAALTGLSLLILLVQRDLGTASIFLLLYTIVLFLATGDRRVLLVTAVGLSLAALIGYYFVDIIRLRLDAWLTPWNDPSGRSFQVVQSLLAIANGGTFGRGPGLGSPGLVPVSISDFIYTAIAEETGLLGSIGLLALFGLLVVRGLRAALLAPDRFQRLLAGGLTAYIGVQSLLIIGGNLRLLPLTGVTLPFVSYGGSSLLTAFLALALLLRVDSRENEPAPLADHRPYTLLAALFLLGFGAASLASGWWAVVRGPDLLTRTDNARRSIADRYVRRGSILDRENQPIAITRQIENQYSRDYIYIDASPLTGYTHPVYGQAGMEASLDNYLRGLRGNPSSLIWWNHLLYGSPPPGLDVRLSLDLRLQRAADALLGDRAGAIILLNAQSGEILTMASHPAYDPNLLDESGAALQADPRAPLLNRAAQGSYPPASFPNPLLAAQFGSASIPEDARKIAFFRQLGFYAAPDLQMPVGAPAKPGQLNNLRVSPLQMALAYAPLSNGGVRPAPRIALAVDTPTQGWVILPASGEPLRVMDEAKANTAAESLGVQNQPFWEYAAKSSEGEKSFTWFAAGTLPDWQGTRLVLVILLEENNAPLIKSIGETLLNKALNP